jgi:hypothetical protein
MIKGLAWVNLQDTITKNIKLLHFKILLHLYGLQQVLHASKKNEISLEFLGRHFRTSGKCENIGRIESTCVPPTERNHFHQTYSERVRIMRKRIQMSPGKETDIGPNTNSMNNRNTANISFIGPCFSICTGYQQV